MPSASAAVVWRITAHAMSTARTTTGLSMTAGSSAFAYAQSQCRLTLTTTAATTTEMRAAQTRHRSPATMSHQCHDRADLAPGNPANGEGWVTVERQAPSAMAFSAVIASMVCLGSWRLMSGANTIPKPLVLMSIA